MNGESSHFDTVATLVLEYLDRKQQGEIVSLESYLLRLEQPALRDEFTRLLGLYDRVDKNLADSSPLKGGVTLGDFRIIELLGRGGMGVVYLAEQVSLKRKVALKILPQHLVSNERAVERFRREILALARLHHRHLVPVFDAGIHEGTPYFVMEYVDGLTLHEVFDALRGQHPDSLIGASVRRLFASPGEEAFAGDYIDVMLRLVIGVADALHHAHENGVLHRDVKPHNIMVAADATPMLFDFGLAREEGAVTLTRTGELAGSPYYVAPEQIRKSPKGSAPALDRRVDVYALGVTLYEALTLRVPFEGNSTEQVLRGILQGSAPAMRKRNPLVSQSLEQVCRKAMDRDARWRYATAKELADDLRRCLARESVTPSMPGLNVRTARWAERHPIRAMAGIVALLTLLAWTGMQLQRIAKARTIARAEVVSANASYRESLLLDEQIAALELEIGDAEAAFKKYLTPAEREAKITAGATVEELKKQRTVLRDLVGRSLDRARERDPSSPGLKTLTLEIRLRDSMGNPDARSVLKGVELEIMTAEAGAPIRHLIQQPAHLTIATRPSSADMHLFRYLAQREVRDRGEPRLVPVPWVRLDQAAWPRTAAVQPGDLSVVLTGIVEEGVAESLDLGPGDLIFALNGRRFDRGVYVLDLEEGGPARRAGLNVGDCLVRLDDHDIEDVHDISALVLEERTRGALGSHTLEWEAPAGQFQFERRSASVAVTPKGLADGSLRLGGPDDLLAQCQLPVAVRLAAVCSGNSTPRELEWQAHVSFGVTADFTAYPLLLSPSSRLTQGNRVELEPGSYLVVTHAEDCAPLRFPLRLPSGTELVPSLELVDSDGVPEDYLYVAPSAVTLGDQAIADDPGRQSFVAGFFMARHELTVGEYYQFLNSPELLAEVSIILANSSSSLIPRQTSGRYFDEILKPWRTPLKTQEPDDLPVSGISQLDAQRYCEWLTSRHHQAGGKGRFRLPTMQEWEKTARGADLRPWVTGQSLEAWFARLRGSRWPVESRERAPVGAFVRDESPYGVRGMTGNVMEWLADAGRIAGGCYGTPTPALARAAEVHSSKADLTQSPLGFRLVWAPDESD